MICCARKPYNICYVTACVVIAIGQNATQAGVYSMEVSFLGGRYTLLSEVLDIGDPIVFNTNGLINEFFEYIGKIANPDGSLFTFEVETVVYDSVQFSTSINFVTI